MEEDVRESDDDGEEALGGGAELGDDGEELDDAEEASDEELDDSGGELVGGAGFWAMIHPALADNMIPITTAKLDFFIELIGFFSRRILIRRKR